MDEHRPGSEQAWTERVEIAGSELVERVKQLVAKGNVRRVIVRNEEGDVLMEIPLTAGVVVGGALALAYPLLAALGAVGALAARVRVDIVRTD